METEMMRDRGRDRSRQADILLNFCCVEWFKLTNLIPFQRDLNYGVSKGIVIHRSN